MVARVRGKQKSLTTLADLIKKYVDTDQPIHVMVHHCNGLDQANELKDLITSRYKCAEMIVTEYSPVMLGAAGPLIGLSVYS